MGTKKGFPSLMGRHRTVPELKPATITVGSYYKEMSAIQTWTLWQRLPPRYQLTSRLLEDADELIVTNSIDKSQAAKTHPSPRPLSSSSRPHSSRSRSGSARTRYQPSCQVPQKENIVISQKENFMLSNNVPEAVQTQLSQSIQQTPQDFSFPKRKSDYVNNFQKQRRVNSARRRLAESPPLPNTVTANTTSAINQNESAPRAHTAPAVFPVTSPNSHRRDSRRPRFSEHIPPIKKSLLNSTTQAKKKTVNEATRVNIFQFDDSKSMPNSASLVQRSQDRENKPKKYTVQDTDRATMYIDSGKVIYFGKSRHDLTQLLKTQSLRADRSNCFLAGLRRDYLKHPKYETKSKRKQENDPRRIAHERVDYNKRVEHILNYYSDENEDEQETSRSRPSSSYRVRSPKGGRIKGLSLTLGAPTRPPSRSASPIERPESPNDFIRLNKKSKLHDRQFYLRTPGIRHEVGLTDLEQCRCGVCRMELQLAIVNGMGYGPALQGLDKSAKESPKNAALPTAVNASKVEMQNIEIVSVHNSSHSGLQEQHKHQQQPHHPKQNAGNKNNAQKVKFQQPEVVPQGNEHTLTISCTLPEVENMPVSEYGIESSRTQDVASICPDAVIEDVS